MSEIIQLLSEVRWEKFKLALLNSIVNSVLFFLVAQYGLGFLGVRYYVTALLSVPVFLYFMNYYLRIYNFKYIEEKNPAIYEILRTSRDARNTDNIVTRKLFQELGKKIQNVSFAKLIDVKNLTARLFVIVMLSFALALFPPVNLAPGLTFGDVVGKILDRDAGPLDYVELKTDDSIYGEKRLAQLGDEELLLNIKQSGDVIDLNSPKDEEKKKFSVNSFPVDAEATAQEAFTESIPEDFELVKAYSLKVKR